MHNVIRRRTIEVKDLREGMLLDFDDGEPRIVKSVTHQSNRTLFFIGETQFSLDDDEQVIVVTMMRLV